jgi:hypothetical protein
MRRRRPAKPKTERGRRLARLVERWRRAKPIEAGDEGDQALRAEGRRPAWYGWPPDLRLASYYRRRFLVAPVYDFGGPTAGALRGPVGACWRPIRDGRFAAGWRFEGCGRNGFAALAPIDPELAFAPRRTVGDALDLLAAGCVANVVVPRDAGWFIACTPADAILEVGDGMALAHAAASDREARLISKTAASEVR